MVTFVFTNKKAVMKFDHNCFFVCDPAETRTLDPLIKSQLLYQLSYGVNFFWNCKIKETFVKQP